MSMKTSDRTPSKLRLPLVLPRILTPVLVLTFIYVKRPVELVARGRPASSGLWRWRCLSTHAPDQIFVMFAYFCTTLI